MARVVVKQDDALTDDPLPGVSGDGRTEAYLARAEDPIHVHRHRLAAGQVLTIDARHADSVVYLWTGEVTGDGFILDAGSSLMLEAGGSVALRASAESVLLSFAASRPAAREQVEAPRVHVLPSGRVPRYREGPEGGHLSGGLHADASLAGCPVWLHENTMAAPPPGAPSRDPEAGIHSHAEDEVIFVTAGQIQLGGRLYGPGTLLAIAAETMYGFGIGPDGLSFINFRPGLPDQIRFKNGMVIDEVGYWRARVERPRYASFAAGAQVGG